MTGRQASSRTMKRSPARCTIEPYPGTISLPSRRSRSRRMSTSAPPPAPLAPPDEQFWDRYNPHHEFPLSSVGVDGHARRRARARFSRRCGCCPRLTISDKTPVPMRAITVAGATVMARGQGSGGGDSRRRTSIPLNRRCLSAMCRKRRLDKVVEDIKPSCRSAVGRRTGCGPKTRRRQTGSPSWTTDLQKKLLEDVTGRRARGPGRAPARPAWKDRGPAQAADATSSANRAIRGS